jgi:serine/threonine-protein kinase HipA
MHLKNFSMIKDDDEWKLSPAYDLLNVAIVNPKDDEELALTLKGKKKKLKMDDFIKLGRELDLNEKQIQGVFKRMEENKVKGFEWIENSFLSYEMKESFKAVMTERYKVLT